MSNQACAAWPIPPKLAERDSEFSLCWVHRSGRKNQTLWNQPPKGGVFFFFFPHRGSPEGRGSLVRKKIECKRNYQFHPPSNAAWALIPSGHQRRVRRANTLTKFTTAWLWLLCLLQRVWRGSTWFALNHSPSGCHSPCKRPSLAAPSCLLCKFHVGHVHTSGLAWQCRWLRINTIKKRESERKGSEQK